MSALPEIFHEAVKNNRNKCTEIIQKNCNLIWFEDYSIINGKDLIPNWETADRYFCRIPNKKVYLIIYSSSSQGGSQLMQIKAFKSNEILTKESLKNYEIKEKIIYAFKIVDYPDYMNNEKLEKWLKNFRALF